MNVYKALNDLEIDLTEFEVMSLTSLEKRRIKKIAVKTLKLKRNWAGLQVGAAAVLAVGLLTANSQTIANMPFVAGLLEQWNHEEQLDWTDYKNVIGESSVTSIGKMTLNEVIVDYNRILISSTFEKADDFKFSYRDQFIPTIWMNGQKLETAGGGFQSIEQNSSMFFSYSELTLKEPLADQVDLQIVYEKLSTSNGHPEGEILQEPWTFNVNVSQSAVLDEMIVKEPMQKIELVNGNSIVVDKMIITPISTTVYYSGDTEKYGFSLYLVDAEGKRYSWDTMYNDDGKGIIYYDGVDLVGEQLFIQEHDLDKPIGDVIKIK